MPNHAYQKVTLSGNPSIIMELYRSVLSESFTQRIAPRPLQNQEDWYNWNHTHWGTKWDICDKRIDSQSWSDDEVYLLFSNSEKESFTFYCWTAWSPPTPVWERLRLIGVHVNASYFCEGGFFVGTWVDGIRTEWVPNENFAKTSLVTDYVLGEPDYFTPEHYETESA